MNVMFCQDYYLLASMGINYAIAVWHAIITKLLILKDVKESKDIENRSRYKNSDQVQEIDSYVLAGFGSLYIVAHFLLILLAYLTVSGLYM